MKPQNKRLMIVVIITFLIGILLGAGGYYLAVKIHSNSGVNIFASTSGNSANSNITSDITPVSTTSSVIVNTSSTSASASVISNNPSGSSGNSSTSSNSNQSVQAPVDMSSWKTYTNYELGFSFQYPPDLNVNTSNPAAVVLTFPQSYFSTTITNADSFSVTVSAACTPEQSFNSLNTSIPSQSVNMSGVTFVENTQQNSPTATSTYDNALIYEGNSNDVCYTIEYNSYNPSNASSIGAIVSDILSTFAFVNTPAGENEADYSAQQSQQDQMGTTTSSGLGLINLAAVSSSTISIGESLTLTGSGFSGNNTTVWISNGSVQGVLHSGAQFSDTSISVTFPAEVCTVSSASISSLNSTTSCPSYLVLNSGVYTISVSDQNGTTEPLYIRIQ